RPYKDKSAFHLPTRRRDIVTQPSQPCQVSLPRAVSWFGGGVAAAPPCAAAAAHPPEANQDTDKRRDTRDSSSDPLLHCATLPRADSVAPCDLSIHAVLHLRSFSRNKQGLKFGVPIV